MKKFLLVVALVLVAVGLLAACAPINNVDFSSFAAFVKSMPAWIIIIIAVILFFIGCGIVWKLIPGFVKVLVIIALAVVLAGVAYGIWKIPFINSALNDVNNFIQSQVTATVPPSKTP
jgi:hypothetical protein